MAISQQGLNPSCSQSLVTKLHSGEPAPTLPVTDEWRRAVIRARKDANLSQEEMARKLGMSQGAYSKIERGKIARRAPELMKLLMSALRKVTDGN